MIRYLLLLAAFGALGLAAWGIYYGITNLSPAERVAANKTSAESARLLARSVRLLEAGLQDPMYRQSVDWTEAAQSVVDAYYEGN